MDKYDNTTRLKLLKLEAERYVSLAKRIGYADISKEEQNKVVEILYAAAQTIFADYRPKNNLEEVLFKEDKIAFIKNHLNTKDKWGDQEEKEEPKGGC